MFSVILDIFCVATCTLSAFYFALIKEIEMELFFCFLLLAYCIATLDARKEHKDADKTDKDQT